jgi:drug/metabolite transporter (DMT)-like permease
MSQRNQSPIHSSLAAGLAMGMLGAIAFSGKAIIVKLAYQHGVDAITFLMLRMLLALPFFVAMAWWSGRAQAHTQPIRLSTKDKIGIVWLGFTGYYLASFLDFSGLAYISASLERLILYLNPTLVLILGVVLYRRPIGRLQWVGLAISYSGVLVVFGHEVQLTGADVGLGAALVFGSAVSYALYLSYSGELVQRLGALRLVGLASCVACVLCLLQFALMRPLSLVFTLDASVWWLSLLNATACTVIPVVLVMLAIERLGAGLAAQVGMVGPMSTLAMAALILGEPITPWVMVGTAAVMVGVFVCTRVKTLAETI